MGDHFRAFSFVDRISLVEPGRRIRGSYAIPPGLEAFPASLIAEAVGQLAAWAAMAAVNFERRPVAGLAGHIELLAAVRPGQLLEMSADLESIDAEAAAYNGEAHADGVPVIRLQHCVGPMIPVTDFDDPAALRERFELICGTGAPPAAFGGLPPLGLDRLEDDPGRSVRAALQLPASAALFGDHFPRRPVFPGSLLLHLNLRLAATLATEIPPPAHGGQWELRALSDVKLRAWIPPGEKLELEARLGSCQGDAATVIVTTRSGKQTMGGARVLLRPRGQP
jgi:3-hydroxyacyl-[acyl-carrier-protein] dehydratase